MKILTLLFLMLSLGAFAQDASTSTDSVDVDNHIYTVVDEPPKFQGGIDGMTNYIRQNLTYPKKARRAGYQGTVYVEFIVGRDGAINGARVIRGITPALDEEAIRVVSGMPKWIAGHQNGKAVHTRFVLPVRFDPDKRKN